MQQSKDELIRLLGLIEHPDHGYFRETYRSGATPMVSRGQTDLSGDVYPASSIRGPSAAIWQSKSGKSEQHAGVPRNIMTSIFFMVTSGVNLLQPRCSLVALQARGA
jgi:predicted cupin superfamily sugar epimerase